MKTCIIFCAAEFDTLAAPIGNADYILAADGGLRHLEKLGLKPNGIIGDFDSLGFVPEGAEVFPVEKDDTDAMLAVRLGLEKGCTRFLLYGGLEGPRLDHTIANLQTLQFLADRGARGTLVGGNQHVTVIRNTTITFPAHCRGHISVFCMGKPARGVTIRGLLYSLEKGTLDAGFPLGVSNHFTGETATVTVEEGSLLIVYDKQQTIL